MHSTFDIAEEKDEIVFNVSGGKNIKHDGEGNSVTRWSNMEKDKMKTDVKTNMRTFTEKEIEALREAYSYSYVNEFGDDDMYHMTEEEKEQRNRYYEVYSKLKNDKRKYKKLDLFIIAYRHAMDFLAAVAENNYIYEPQEFMLRVLQGKNTVIGLEFPIYTGKDKKRINWQYVTNYIFDRTLDPKDFMANADVSSVDEEIDDIPDEEIDDIIRRCPPSENEDNGRVYFDADCMEQPSNIAVFDEDDSSFKKLSKDNPGILSSVQDMKKIKQAKSQLDQMSWELRNWECEMDAVVEKDISRGYKKGAMPTFHGSYGDKKAVDAFLHDFDEWERRTKMVSYRGRPITLGEYNDILLRDTFEKAGFNVRNMISFKSQDEELQKIDKKMAKKTKKLRKRLVELQERKDERLYGKKEAKRMRKENEKAEKLKTKRKKKSIKHAKDVEKTFDNMLLDTVNNGKKYKNFDEYEEDMLDFRMGVS